jgi:serine/threonine protein kinase/tetratricopeptide (TPR) repeat protein
MSARIRLGPFELLEPIARGGMAEVWRGIHLSQSIPVAVKVITSTRAREQEFLNAFKTEVQAVARLHHPSIVLIFDHGEVTPEAAVASNGRLLERSPYLAMELASWGSLDRVRLPLRWDDLLRILLSLLDALAHAHARGVIHRDLKPGNILLSAPGDVRPGLKLTDFGIAHAVEHETKPGSAEASSGTPHFMAPEQFLGEWRNYGPWTDLYALGCVAHMLCTGRLPFEADNPLQLAWAHVNTPPPRLSTIAELPPAFESWLMRLLEKNPADRFQRAADAGWALMMIAEGAKKRSKSILEDETPTQLPEIKQPKSMGLYVLGKNVGDMLSPESSADGDYPTVLSRNLSKLEPKADAAADTELAAPQFGRDTLVSQPPDMEERPRLPNTLELATIVRAVKNPGTLPWVEESFLPRTYMPIGTSTIPADETSPTTAYPRRIPPLPKSWRRATPPGPSMQLVGAGLGLYGLRAIPLVGRTSERDAIWRALQAVRESRMPRFVLLSGAAGNGKSRIVEWMSQRADEVGAAIVLKAVHGPILSPADGLGRMVARHLRSTDLPRSEMSARTEKILRAQGVTDSTEWNALTELMSPSPTREAQFVPGGTTAIRFRSAAERHVLVRRLVARIAEERPVILWLEDVHWGSDALAFAEHVLLHALKDPCPVLMLATVRDEALPERKTEAAMIDELLGSSFASRVHVPPLAEEDQEKLVRELLLFEDALAKEVVARTGGNPLFAVQLVGDFVQRGVLDVGQTGFVLKPGERAALPDDIHEVWTLRIERTIAELGAPVADSLAALELAAVLGRDVDRGEHEAAAKLEGLLLSPRLIDVLIQSRLAQNVEGGFSFSHGMLRESLERSAREAGRFERHHLASAEMLEQRYGAEAPGISERLGVHRLAAGDLSRALEPLLRGAEERLKSSEYREAIELLTERDRALTRLVVGEEDARLGEGWVIRARIAVFQGRLVEAQIWAERAQKQALRWGWRHVLPDALVEQANVAYEKGDQSRSIELFGEAKELYAWNKDRAGIARCELGIGDAIYRRGDLDAAEAKYLSTLKLAEENSDALGMAAALYGIGYVALWRGDRAAALAAFDRQLALCEGLGDRYRVARSMSALGEVARQSGDLETAELHYRKALAIDLSIASSNTWIDRMNLALVLIAKNELREARRLIDEVLDGLGQTAEPNQLAVVHTEMLPTLVEPEDFELWDHHFALGAEALKKTELCDGDVAWVLERAGDNMRRAGDPVRARHSYELALAQWTALQRADKVAAIDEKIAALRQH